MNSYYFNTEVQARMLEFLGGNALGEATCHYLTAGDTHESHHRQPRPVAALPDFWESNFDISRSLWDRESLIVHLDIEYVNFDFPSKAYLEPERIFDLQRPVELAVEAVLLDYDIIPLHLLSGRGHHFVWRIRQNSRAFGRLAKLGRVRPTLERFNAQPHRPNGEPVPPKLGAAFAGLGLVMEYLAHRIKKEAAPMCAIPIKLTALEVGPGQNGREMISIDISEYGDPLSARVIRVPFSFYLKPWQQRGVLGNETVESLPPTFLIPLHGIDSRRGFGMMHDISQVIVLAGRTSTRIPDQTPATNNLVTAYKNSSLSEFHDWFFAEEPEPPANRPQTYDRMPVETLPFCVRHILEHPNDLLLRPANVERILRVMLALGWHPRHVAGLIRSRFEHDYQWGDRWNDHDAATRADFYTRLFAGMIVTGCDHLVDFNCQSAKEEKLCFATDCPFNLEHYKTSLINRRTHERLASRPFNRLFLPEEHL